MLADTCHLIDALLHICSTGARRRQAVKYNTRDQDEEGCPAIAVYVCNLIEYLGRLLP
jgi:hypothetical protein